MYNKLIFYAAFFTVSSFSCRPLCFPLSLLLFFCMPCHLDTTLWNYTHSDDDGGDDYDDDDDDGDEGSCGDTLHSAIASDGHSE